MSDFGKLRQMLCAALLLAAGAAHAQYVWIDEKGVRQYSDRPPPSSIPAKNVLKSPQPLSSFATEPAASAPAPSAAPAAKATPTLADREADFRKRQKEQQEAQQKQELEFAMRKQVCANALRTRASLEAGTRLKDVDANGEVTYLSDEERARRVAQANQAIAANGCR